MGEIAKFPSFKLQRKGTSNKKIKFPRGLKEFRPLQIRRLRAKQRRQLRAWEIAHCFWNPLMERESKTYCLQAWLLQGQVTGSKDFSSLHELKFSSWPQNVRMNSIDWSHQDRAEVHGRPKVLACSAETYSSAALLSDLCQASSLLLVSQEPAEDKLSK